ncbi:MAG: hypothetical protein ACRD2T_00335, partial [Thermoanaerobaculia bacterium]
MKQDTAMLVLSEEKLGHAMVRSRLITEIQLKTAFDYQRSLGGTLADVVVKLGFVRPPALTKFLSDAQLSTATAADEAPSDTTPRPALNPAPRVQTPPQETSGKPSLPSLGKPEPPPPARPADEEDLPTQRPNPALKSAAGGASGSDLGAVLEALLNLLARKGVITPREEELIIQAGGGGQET